MIGIHIGLNLEHESRHDVFFRLDNTGRGRLRAWRRREFGERVEQILDAEILQGRAEIDRRQVAFAERGEVERPAGFLDDRQFLGDRIGVQHGVFGGKRREIERLRGGVLAILGHQPHVAALDVVGAGEIAALADRPGHRRGVERQRFFDLVQYLERVAAFAIHFIDEGDDRNVAQPADLK